MNVSFFEGLLSAISQRGRQLLDLRLRAASRAETIEDLTLALLSERGEASGVALACQILNRYHLLDDEGRLAFFAFLTEALAPGPDGIEKAARAYLSSPSPAALQKLAAAVEPPRQEFLRRLNLAPGATGELVKMRADLLDLLLSDPGLRVLDNDFVHLFSTWFNRGFLVLQRIDWSTPASILEKLIQYEAVHRMRGWEDLRRRLDPADRRCFAFFHPSLIDEPLIFVEVALDREILGSIQEVLEQETQPPLLEAEPAAAIFYSISNCQKGLRNISFGNFLIKQVVEDLAKANPALKTFATLSPAPGFRAWLNRVKDTEELRYLSDAQRAQLQELNGNAWVGDEKIRAALKPVLMTLAAHYFLLAKTAAGRPADPVARFHLGNGARLERVNWLGDISEKGLRESYGLMVNYRYEPKDIEHNHEAYVNQGHIAASKAVRAALVPVKSRALAPAGR